MHVTRVGSLLFSKPTGDYIGSSSSLIGQTEVFYSLSPRELRQRIPDLSILEGLLREMADQLELTFSAFLSGGGGPAQVIFCEQLQKPLSNPDRLLQATARRMGDWLQDQPKKEGGADNPGPSTAQVTGYVIVTHPTEEDEKRRSASFEEALSAFNTPGKRLVMVVVEQKDGERLELITLREPAPLGTEFHRLYCVGNCGSNLWFRKSEKQVFECEAYDRSGGWCNV